MVIGALLPFPSHCHLISFDSTPLRVFPNTLAQWPEGLGVLTPVGVRQHRELGAIYRKRLVSSSEKLLKLRTYARYVEDFSLVSGRFQDQEVYVRSTGKQRTLMSAYSFMSGFFPLSGNETDTGLLGGAQPVPIYSESLSNDKLIYAFNKSCPALVLHRRDRWGTNPSCAQQSMSAPSGRSCLGWSLMVVSFWKRASQVT